MPDARWLAKIVNEIKSYRDALYELRSRMCPAYYAPTDSCNNGLLGWSEELGKVYKLLVEAEAILRNAETKYTKQLKAAALQELAEERAWELIKATREAAAKAEVQYNEAG